MGSPLPGLLHITEKKRLAWLIIKILPVGIISFADFLIGEREISYDRVCILKWAHRKEVFPLRLGLLLGPVPMKEVDVSTYIKLWTVWKKHTKQKNKNKIKNYKRKKKIVTHKLNHRAGAGWTLAWLAGWLAGLSGCLAWLAGTGWTPTSASPLSSFLFPSAKAWPNSIFNIQSNLVAFQ